VSEGAARDVAFRTARPVDHAAIVGVVDEWWGRPIADALPRLFLDHFWATSTVAEVDGSMVGFLVGFLSPSERDEAYIHFVGVHPDHRASGLARRLYERFFAVAVAEGRTRVSAVTSPRNETSIAFHRRMGFEVVGPIEGYNRPGTAHVRFERRLP
jgi:ribosomal protein S18 acetylase RimI-like enzyme